MIDVTYGNISEDEAERRANAIEFAEDDYPAGATEAWIANLVKALLIASGARTVLETGCFMGHTSRVLLETLEDLGGGDLILCEIDEARARYLNGTFGDMSDLTSVRVRQQDAFTVIRELPDGWLGFAFVDDDHQKAHVAEEIEALLPKMAPGGIITFHDVFGVCDLQEVVTAYGGYALDFPRCGPAGGLGILQVR